MDTTNLQVGDWWSICCEEDMIQIEDQEALVAAKEYIEEYKQEFGNTDSIYVFKTEREALVFWLDDAKNNPDRVAGILDRLKELDRRDTTFDANR